MFAVFCLMSLLNLETNHFVKSSDSFLGLTYSRLEWDFHDVKKFLLSDFRLVVWCWSCLAFFVRVQFYLIFLLIWVSWVFSWLQASLFFIIDVSSWCLTLSCNNTCRWSADLWFFVWQLGFSLLLFTILSDLFELVISDESNLKSLLLLSWNESREFELV